VGRISAGLSSGGIEGRIHHASAGGGGTGRWGAGVAAAPAGAGPIGKRGCRPPDAGGPPDLGRQPAPGAALARQRRAGSQRREQTGKVSVGAPITTGW
jgi:hypothetical protein